MITIKNIKRQCSVCGKRFMTPTSIEIELSNRVSVANRIVSREDLFDKCEKCRKQLNVKNK